MRELKIILIQLITIASHADNSILQALCFQVSCLLGVTRLVLQRLAHDFLRGDKLKYASTKPPDRCSVAFEVGLLGCSAVRRVNTTLAA